MPSRHDLADSLHHIIENAERVARYLAGLDRQAFEQKEAIRDAVERCIERVCEAPIASVNARKNLCRANLGATFAAWESVAARLRPGGCRYRLEHGAQGGMLLYLLVGLYLLATAFSSSDEDLLLGKAVTIAQIGASLPVSFSFAIAPSSSCSCTSTR